MKKDAFYYGSLIAFAAFILMIVIFIYEAWKTSRSDSKNQGIPVDQTQKGKSGFQDFSRYKTIPTEDGSEMVLIPEGPFQMGSPASGGDLDEMPQHPVYLPAFYIDQKEVTQAQFSKFSVATQYPKPVVPVFQEDLSLITKPELPVVGVSWNTAQDYCQWAEKRLPTEAEWEKAAGGDQSFRWPWGNDFVEKAANLAGEEDGYKFLAPPGRFESGRSPYGLYDMAGNVAEWVADWYDADYYKNAPFKVPKGPEKGKFRVYRGGSWDDSSVNARVAKRFMAAPHQTSAVIGFRCAKGVPPGG
ncbi:MAG TPA: SUMF1/EgtB/PvdO family nonheme iron enzyme [Nitrospiria bacterium]|jgi:formylglycine-generating enzyme required for sulfatase activity|nr:SUMF1/EgtB/PvdO family nonheme iron enzyme [Nitrospiria bacterium]